MQNIKNCLKTIACEFFGAQSEGGNLQKKCKYWQISANPHADNPLPKWEKWESGKFSPTISKPCSHLISRRNPVEEFLLLKYWIALESLSFLAPSIIIAYC